jgi:DNA end-binding protein Ku
MKARPLSFIAFRTAVRAFFWLPALAIGHFKERSSMRGVSRPGVSFALGFGMRAIWKGSISFGLVNIPVGLYSATRSANEIKFRLLRDSDQSPIRYKRVAEVDEKEVPWEHIVKGYEFEKDNFVVMTQDDFKRVTLTSNQTVDIKEFVNLEEIDPMFFDEPYFLAPEKGGAKAYALLRESLQRSGKVGLAKVIIKTREHLAAVKPLGKALVLELMHFADELADPKELSLPDEKLGQKELAMADSLIEKMVGKWDPETYKDEYREAVMAIIEEKIKAGGKPAPGKPQRAARPTNVVDLVETLRRSLEETAAKRKGSKPSKTAATKRKKVA